MEIYKLQQEIDFSFPLAKNLSWIFWLEQSVSRWNTVFFWKKIVTETISMLLEQDFTEADFCLLE